MDINANQFLRSAASALDDVQLKTALDRGAKRADADRVAALAETVDAAALRQQGRGARLRALDSLPELLEQMERSVTARGGVVLWAEDAAEANQHVLAICRRHNLKRGVKSKSMVTEETDLVPALAAAGIEMLETDLGEFIIQTDGSHPSHIIMPIIHMTREQVRDLFVEKLGMDPIPDPVDPVYMTKFARQLLRQRYLDADFGMSGGNFLIAETGTVVVVENEGNGRLSTGLPPVHIALVGIEKIIPTWEDFATLLQLLTRSATGQRLSVYVNLFNGPANDGAGDGPDHFYLILVDGGRSAMYDGEYAEALACIRCGACLNTCPVYQNIGGHSYGWVYPGPIGSVVTPLLAGRENAAPLPFASSLCGACKSACPVDINIPRMLLALRRDLRPQQGALWQAAMKGFALSFSSPLLFETGERAAGLFSAVTGDAALTRLPPPLDGWTDSRDFPPFAHQSFHDWWRANRGG